MMPVCVPTNNQNNTDGDIQVNQDPDIFNYGPIVVPPESNGSTSNEDPDNLEPFFAKISRIKETSPKSITSDPTSDHAHLPQSQTSSAPTPPSNCVSVIRSNTQAQPGKIQRASVSHRETPYTVPSQFQCDQCDFSSPSQHGLKIHTGKAHKLHTVSLPCTTSVVCNLIPVNFTTNDGVINCVFQPQPSSTLPSQNAPSFSAPATSIIPNSTAAPEAEKKETAVQKFRRLEKKKEKEDHMRTKFLIDQISKRTAAHVPQSQPGKIKHASVSSRGAPYTVPPTLQEKQFQCDQCAFSSPSEHGLKVHTGKAHKVLIPVNTNGVITYLLQPSSTLLSQNAPAAPTPAKSANAIRCKRWRKNDKIKKQNAVENLKSLEEQFRNMD